MLSHNSNSNNLSAKQKQPRYALSSLAYWPAISELWIIALNYLSIAVLAVLTQLVYRKCPLCIVPLLSRCLCYSDHTGQCHVFTWWKDRDNYFQNPFCSFNEQLILLWLWVLYTESPSATCLGVDSVSLCWNTHGLMLQINWQVAQFFSHNPF